jgi:hypothetical protein
MNIENAELNDAIAQTIAKQILDGLSQEHRDQFLIASVAESLKDWKIKQAIERVVATRAEEVAWEMMKEDIWINKLKDAVVKGFANYLVLLPGAFLKTIMNAVHGNNKQSGYQESGKMLTYLQEALEQQLKAKSP